MDFKYLVLFFCITVPNLILSAPVENGPDKVLACYVRSSLMRNTKYSFELEKVPTNLCTHLIYSFAQVGSDFKMFIEGNNETLAAELESFVKFGNDNGMKVLLSVGGYNETVRKLFTDMWEPDKLNTFMDSVVAILRQYNFDGLNVQWQWPERGVDSPIDDRSTFVSLIRKLKDKLENNKFFYTVTLNGRHDLLEMYDELSLDDRYRYQLYEVLINGPKYVFLMAYDFHGSWDDYIYSHSPLYDNTSTKLNSVNRSVEFLLKREIPANKIVLIVALHGRPYILKTKIGSDVSPFSKASYKYNEDELKNFHGHFLNEGNFFTYNEICYANRSSTWITRMDNETRTPYMISNGSRVIVYENAESLKEKIEFVNKKQLAGVAVWSLGSDDYEGTECNDGGSERKFPLVQAIYSALFGVEDRKLIFSSDLPTTSEGPSGNTTDSITVSTNDSAVDSRINSIPDITTNSTIDSTIESTTNGVPDITTNNTTNSTTNSTTIIPTENSTGIKGLSDSTELPKPNAESLKENQSGNSAKHLCFNAFVVMISSVHMLLNHF